MRVDLIFPKKKDLQDAEALFEAEKNAAISLMNNMGREMLEGYKTEVMLALRPERNRLRQLTRSYCLSSCMSTVGTPSTGSPLLPTLGLFSPSPIPDSAPVCFPGKEYAASLTVALRALPT